MLDEALEIVAGLWTGEPFSFHGAHYSIDEVTALPVPPQRPRPPIWVGGGYPSRRPVERALRWDGSCLYRQADKGEFVLMSPEDVRDLRARAGERSWTIAVGGSGRGPDADADRAHIRSVADAGADWWVEWVPPASRDEMRTAVVRGPLV